jgi:hypothetical protein
MSEWFVVRENGEARLARVLPVYLCHHRPIFLRDEKPQALPQGQSLRPGIVAFCLQQSLVDRGSGGFVAARRLSMSEWFVVRENGEARLARVLPVYLCHHRPLTTNHSLILSLLAATKSRKLCHKVNH